MYCCGVCIHRDDKPTKDGCKYDEPDYRDYQVDCKNYVYGDPPRLLQKIKCFFGLHRLSGWKVTSTERYRVCPSCGKKSRIKEGD
jgi:hypothetical protein